jgi:hypothetical protein
MHPKERVKTGERYRIRRFVCDLGHTKTVFADGVIDEKVNPHLAINEVNNNYKKEQEARDGN